MKCVQYLFLGSLLGMGRSADGHVFSLFLVKVSLLHSRFQCCHATQRNATQRNAAQRWGGTLRDDTENGGCIAD